MADKNYTLALVFLLVGCGAPLESPNYGQEIRADLGYSQTETIDPLDAAIRAREFIYATNSPVTVNTSSDEYYYYNREVKYQAYANMKRGAIYVCDGMSQVFVFMMEELGFQARVVIIGSAPFFDNLDKNQPSHTLPEVMIGAKWLAVDPTFNTVYQCRGEGPYLSASGMIACGAETTWLYGRNIDPQRTIEYYYSSLAWMIYGWTTLNDFLARWR